MKIFIEILAYLEKIFAYLQGKGFGSSTINKEVSSVLKLLSVTPKLCIDIGGNKGEYSSALLKKYTELKIVVFEPSSVNIIHLKNKFEKENNLTIVPYALSNKSGEAHLYTNFLGSGLASLTKRNLDHFGVDFSTEEVIKTVRFIDYYKEYLADSILDVVKIDVEGHELDVLKGFDEVISKTRVIQFEFGGCNIDTRTFFRDFWIFFSEKNFKIYRISPIGAYLIYSYAESLEFFSTTNFICVNQNL